MFTTMLKSCCCGCYGFDDDNDSFKSDLSARALLQRTMDTNQRRVGKVYGKKTIVPATNSAAARIFATPSPLSASGFPDVPNHSPVRRTLSASSFPAVPNHSPVRRTLEDITNTIGKLSLHDNSNSDDEWSDQRAAKDRGRSKKADSFYTISKATRATRSITTSSSTEDPREKWLRPLVRAYESNGCQKMPIQKWSDVLDKNWELEKIAESSFAEVFKVTNFQGTSILKIMALKPPKGPGSQRETAVEVEEVISEVMIMDLMAELPGFLEFKGAHIIEGRPLRSIREAYEVHATKAGSSFPNPASYHKSQVFLALELGDAGIDIEHFSIVTISQIWDIFLGVVIALSIGELQAEFEHRDLHEGNVCIKQVGKLTVSTPCERHKFNYSGLHVTLLDYTLSRASHSGTTIYRNLENDTALFEPSELLQHQMYRRMRVWTFYRSHGITHPSFARDSPPIGTWKDYMPYTNAIWIYYLFNYITKKYEGGAIPLKTFSKETEELRLKLNPDRRVIDGGFRAAGDILGYCLKQGWISEEDLIDIESSRISGGETITATSGSKSTGRSYDP